MCSKLSMMFLFNKIGCVATVAKEIRKILKNPLCCYGNMSIWSPGVMFYPGSIYQLGMCVFQI